jgi:hypothetical protein
MDAVPNLVRSVLSGRTNRTPQPARLLTGVQDEHDGGVVGEDDWRGLAFTLTP